jgi:hypothetical protein
MRNALSYEPGVLHMSDKVPDGSSGGMAYKDADVNGNVNVNYGEFQGAGCCGLTLLVALPLQMCVCVWRLNMGAVALQLPCKAALLDVCAATLHVGKALVPCRSADNDDRSGWIMPVAVMADALDTSCCWQSQHFDGGTLNASPVFVAAAAAAAAASGGMRLGLGGETLPAITLDSLNLTNVSVLKVGSSLADLVCWCVAVSCCLLCCRTCYLLLSWE